jgi:Family of unknown function (DUF6299)
MSALRLLVAAVFAVGLVPLAAESANAAPPGNDEAQGAVVVNVGDQIEQDTSEATTNAGDAALNANCGAPATLASVWFQYAPVANSNVALDTTASDFSAGLMIFQGTPTADSLIACGPGTLGLQAEAGQTYFVMAFSDTPGVNGGNLVLSVKNAPLPRAHVSVAKQGVAFRGGAAKLHGTYSCRHDESFSFGNAHLLQRAGRLKIQANAGVNLQCDGRRHRWSARLVSPVGTYARGNALARIAITVCGLIECRQDLAKRHIHLSSARLQRQWMSHPTTARVEHPRPMLSLQRHWPSG